LYIAPPLGALFEIKEQFEMIEGEYDPLYSPPPVPVVALFEINEQLSMTGEPVSLFIYIPPPLFAVSEANMQFLIVGEEVVR